MPLELWPALLRLALLLPRLAVLRFALPPPREFDLLRLCGLRLLLLAVAREPLLEREVVLRLRADADVLAFELDPFAELPLLCLLPEAALLAISHPCSIENIPARSATRSIPA
jgi:hypothetical protein